MNTRLDKAAGVIGDLREKVGQIHEVGKAAQELVNIMRAPKLRGGMGELFLGDLLSQILPHEHYTMPYRFKSGDAVDAVIRIGPRLVPADAKFPYENFKRVIPVSPNSFYAYVQTILLGLRGMKVEERAQEILGELSRLRGDFAKIQENFRVLGRHLANASGSYSETERTMTKLDAKLTQIEQPPPQKEITPPPSLPGLD